MINWLEGTMGLHWVLPLLSSLLPPDLAARVPTDGAVDASIDWEAPPNNGAMIYDGVDGKLLKDLTVPGRIVRVSRRKLRVLCQEGIDVNWGHTLDNISCNESDGTVTVTFTNGQKYNGTLLVGADGPRSLVRDYLFASSSYSAQAQPIDGVVNISMDVCYGDAEVAKLVRTAHPVWFLALSPEMCLFMSVQDVKSEKPETWRFFIFVSWLGEKDESLDSAGRMKLIKDKGAKFAEVSLTCNRRSLIVPTFSYILSGSIEANDCMSITALPYSHSVDPRRHKRSVQRCWSLGSSALGHT